MTRPDDRHAILTLTGAPAQSLAERLLADAAEGIEEAWADILDRSGASNVGESRFAHDWDPGRRRLSVLSRFSSSA